MLRKRMLNREKLIGTQISMTDTASSKMAGCAGYDFVWVDGEHTYFSYENILNHINALKCTGTPCIVRVPDCDLTFTKKVLEMGPDGILFPMIRNAAQARKLISYTLYPPLGERGIGPNNAINYGMDSIHDYIKESTENFCRLVQIEYAGMLDELDEIAQIPYIDGFVFGPFDFMLTLGLRGSIYSEEEANIIKEITDKLHSYGKAVGLIISSTSDWEIEHWKKLGIDFISAGSDYEYIKMGNLANKASLDKIWK